MAWVYSIMQMGPSTKASGRIISKKGLPSLVMRMGRCTKGCSRMIECLRKRERIYLNQSKVLKIDPLTENQESRRKRGNQARGSLSIYSQILTMIS